MSNNSLTTACVQNFLINNGLSKSEESIYMMIRQYSASRDGKLNFDDYLNLIHHHPPESNSTRRPTVFSESHKNAFALLL